MPFLGWPVVAALGGWVLGFFSSDGLAKLLRLALILAVIVAFFYVYRITQGA